MTLTTTIYLVRHGATAWNDAGRYQGRADVPLSARGVAEVRALADQLRAVHFDAAYSSTLSRARMTAEILLEGSGLRALPLPDLDELSYGVLQGLTPEHRKARHEPLDSCWRDTPWAVRFPEGESLADVEARVVPAWKRIVEAHRGETVLVAAHGHVNRVLLLPIMGLPTDAFWTIDQPNAACVIVRVGATQTRTETLCRAAEMSGAA